MLGVVPATGVEVEWAEAAARWASAAAVTVRVVVVLVDPVVEGAFGVMVLGALSAL